MARIQQLGKYRLVRQLGRGGMGAVYEAEDAVLRRRVALKILPPRTAANPDALQRFQREARAAAQVSHPNVVTIFEVAQAESLHFIAMELVRGVSAEHRLARGPLDWQEATRITAEVCRGLTAAHRAGLIHRDVKPSNILLGADGQVKLADFGLVKPVDPDTARLTGDQSVLGTPQYMSPEQCRGERLTRLSDIYSLGTTYFCLLTGRAPFVRDAPLQVMMAHCTDTVPDPQTLCPDVPEGCAVVVRRAMAREPADRYPTAEEMLAALERLLESTVRLTRPAEPIAVAVAVALPAAPVPRRRGLRRGLAVGAGMLLALGLAGTLWWAGLGQGPPTRDVSGWTPLFNGRDLDNLFVTPDGGGWTVQDGILVGRGDLVYCFTRRNDLANFHCRVQMKLAPRSNSGICVRAVPGERPPQGYEVQLGWNTPTGRSEFGGLFRNPLQPDTDSLRSVPCEVPPDTWFEAQVIADGPRITMTIDGVTVTEFVEREPLRRRGHVALQSGSKESVVHVRRFEVRELP